MKILFLAVLLVIGCRSTNSSQVNELVGDYYQVKMLGTISESLLKDFESVINPSHTLCFGILSSSIRDSSLGDLNIAIWKAKKEECSIGPHKSKLYILKERIYDNGRHGIYGRLSSRFTKNHVFGKYTIVEAKNSPAPLDRVGANFSQIESISLENLCSPEKFSFNPNSNQKKHYLANGYKINQNDLIENYSTELLCTVDLRDDKIKISFK